MEKEIKDALNFLIGAATTVKSETEKILSKIDTEFKDLANKGATDTGEVPTNIRKYAEEAFREVDKLVSDIKVKVDQAKDQINKIIPEKK